MPLIIDLLAPRSVVDFGCGSASWLSEFGLVGNAEVLGIDYDSVAYESLQIPSQYMLKADIGKPVKLERRFDLAMCVEVAEHLPVSSAPQLVENLINAAPVVLFSAAIPHQGGVHHINEQWTEYWAELFAAHDYVPVDAIRETIWNDDNVAYWYAQNLLLYVKRESLSVYPKLEEALKITNPKFLTRIHPRSYVQKNNMLKNPFLMLGRFAWNVIPRNIRVRLVKPFWHLIWGQISARVK
ncbi:MAG: class I SAM-dependent methyltransferase [Candidatus Obscuribacterales bacterium]|nr:class I SAM-dependent methyltransferase [Candidatus Obscuribacterales bacterium]